MVLEEISELELTSGAKEILKQQRFQGPSVDMPIIFCENGLLALKAGNLYLKAYDASRHTDTFHRERDLAKREIHPPRDRFLTEGRFILNKNQTIAWYLTVS